MDPFSISIAAVGITGTAINGISKLHDTITRIRDAQESFDDIRLQLDNIRRPLNTLQSLVLDTDEWSNEAAKQALVQVEIGKAVNDCGQACEAFEKRLQRKLMKRSQKNTLTLKEKMTFGIWDKERTLTLKARVENCQRIVHFGISSAQM